MSELQIGSKLSYMSAAWETLAHGSWDHSMLRDLRSMADQLAADAAGLGCGALDEALTSLALMFAAVEQSRDRPGRTARMRVERVLEAARAVAGGSGLVQDGRLSGWAGPHGLSPDVCSGCAKGEHCLLLNEANELGR